jgi:hypothetical protein
MLAKLVPTFADRGWCVVSATDPHDCILGLEKDTLEKFYMYNITEQGLQMNENAMSGYNPIYEFLRNTKQNITLKTQPRISLPTSTTHYLFLHPTPTQPL